MTYESITVLLEAASATGLPSFRAAIEFGPDAERFEVEIFAHTGAVLPLKRRSLVERIRNATLPN